MQKRGGADTPNHDDFRLVKPVLAAKRDEYLLAIQLGVEQGLERQVKYMRHLAGSCTQSLHDGDTI
jgi:hypothetical protein